jgi:hypothetical protein
MLRLPLSHYPIAYALYLDQSAYFPLIAAVLGGEQDGVVYVDRVENPVQVYVEHVFGFAQVFGKLELAFEQSLQRYLLVDKIFSSAKVRLYTPHKPSFLDVSEFDSLCSWRQHFKLDVTRTRSAYKARAPQKGLSLVRPDLSHTNLIDATFGVVSRFWRTPNDFVCHSNAVLALVKGNAAALCYAAAVAGGRAEIDVLTLPAYRHLGLAKAVVSSFNQLCLTQNILPLWDCYINNTASMALCHSAGFIPLGDPYPFFTFKR